MLAISLSITLFSFACIPTFLGFFAKQMVLSAALQDGFMFLAIIAVLTSVISAVYYLFVIKTMFFETHTYKLNTKLFNVKLSTNFKIVLSNSFSFSIFIFIFIIIFILFLYYSFMFFFFFIIFVFYFYYLYFLF